MQPSCCKKYMIVLYWIASEASVLKKESAVYDVQSWKPRK